MKLFGHRQRGGSWPERCARAFTVVELMIAASLFLVVIGGVVFAQISGVKMYNLTKAKLGASDQARGAMNLMVTEVRSAKIVRVGTGSISSFVPITEGNPMQGSAIQIHSTTNTNYFIRYFLDSTDKKLKRTTNGATSTDIVAEYITNTVPFSLESYNGTILTASQNNRVVSVALQFFQVQYPIVTIGGPGSWYDFYQLRTKITRRVLE